MTLPPIGTKVKCRDYINGQEYTGIIADHAGTYDYPYALVRLLEVAGKPVAEHTLWAALPKEILECNL